MKIGTGHQSKIFGMGKVTELECLDILTLQNLGYSGYLDVDHNEFYIYRR